MPPGDVAPVLISFIMFGSVAVYSCLKLLVKHREKEMEYRAQGKLTPNSSAENDSLREEIANLRQMTTQYALSTQNSMEEMKHKVEFLEKSLHHTRVSDPSASIASRPIHTTPRHTTEEPPVVDDEVQVQQAGLAK